jgi:selT/selW/selH-like putative selenoprotein
VATVREKLGIDGSIEQGSSGEFTVWSDGELVFSKADAGRFPEDDEVLAKLAT